MPIDESIFQVWAPAGGLWSNWVKPVVFACMEGVPPEGNWPEAEGSQEWVPRPAERVALVFDLPGGEGVKWGLAAARLGYRPVALYNAIPWPFILSEENKFPDDRPQPAPVMVEMRSIVDGLRHAAGEIEKLALPRDAPPAFLLDANRRAAMQSVIPGAFDNRSISFTTDFPSADFLLAQKIREVILVQATATQPQSDLAHTLFRWQKSGLTIKCKNLADSGGPAVCSIKAPSLLGSWWLRLMAAVRLRRNSAGEFGGFVPDDGSGGGG